LTAGRTSFVLTNDGQEAHFLAIAKLVDGKNLDDYVNAEDNAGITDGDWETGLAAAGGDDEAVTLDLEPGNYVFSCWISGSDGTPHAMLGMTKEVVVE
jgi:plastocyanin